MTEDAAQFRLAYSAGRPATNYDAGEWITLATEPWVAAVMRRGVEYALEIHAEAGFSFRRALYPISARAASVLIDDRVARRLVAATLVQGVQNDRAPSIPEFDDTLRLVVNGPRDALADRLEGIDGVRHEVRYWLRTLYRGEDDAPDLSGPWGEVLARLGRQP